MTQPSLYVGNACALDSDAPAKPHTIPLHHLTTHGIVVGASGTGKTGALIVLLEEAARNGVPTLVIDVKGDMPNLGLVFPDFSAQSTKPWVQKSPGDHRSVQQIAEAQATERRKALEAWGLGLKRSSLCRQGGHSAHHSGSHVGRAVARVIRVGAPCRVVAT